jgi:hypothetical protein
MAKRLQCVRFGNLERERRLTHSQMPQPCLFHILFIILSAISGELIPKGSL